MRVAALAESWARQHFLLLILVMLVIGIMSYYLTTHTTLHTTLVMHALCSMNKLMVLMRLLHLHPFRPDPTPRAAAKAGLPGSGARSPGAGPG
jgi:hypothetical protein